jgi:hypothetical protein
MKSTYENGDPILSIIPILIALDHRLSLIQTRVLIAIYSYRNKNTGVCSVKREKLSHRCGYSPRTISEATTQLVNLGWLIKEGKGGFSKSSEFHITVPDLGTVTDCSTVPGSGTVPDPGTVPGSASTTVPDPGTRKEQSIYKNKKPPLPPFDPFAIDLPYCLSSDQWKRWVEFRRTIRKPINESTADEQIRKLIAWSREGHDPNEILATSIANSWQGIFKPKVFESHGQRQDNSAPAKVKRAIAERDARRKAESLGAIGDPGAIEGEFERISF